jgi:hypothetical protein
MKVFVFENNLHVKNKEGLQLMCNKLGWDLFFSPCWNVKKIEEADIFYSPGQTFAATDYPNKLYIFGPHLGVYPEIVSIINSIPTAKNAIYIQPSDWVTNLLKDDVKSIPIVSLPFAVNTSKFYPILPQDLRTDVLLYYKSRTEQDLSIVKFFLHLHNISYKEFSYKKKYNQEDYIASLRKAKCMIVVDAHEEALACDVPLLVWNIQKMSDELGGRNIDKFATTIPYWNEECGEVFYEASQLPDVWDTLQRGIKSNKYNPRKFILNTLSPAACAKRLEELVKTHKPSS